MTSAQVPGALQAAGALAADCFHDNLLMSFIGGSYACHRPKAGSDIDTFVVLRSPDAAAERDYARQLRDLHAAAGLQFDHCGEVFDRSTLKDLLAFTDEILISLPQIQDLACYQADCLLSVFRKGDVVFKFLTDPKIHIVGDQSYLDALQLQAEDYFARFPRPRVQLSKGQLNLGGASPESVAHDRLTTSDWIDSPIGVGLHRWFAGHRIPDHAVSAADAAGPEGDRSRCPSPGAGPSTLGSLLRSQCLAHTHPEGSRPPGPASLTPAEPRPRRKDEHP
jgi:hypothetical protein